MKGKIPYQIYKLIESNFSYRELLCAKKYTKKDITMDWEQNNLTRNNISRFKVKDSFSDETFLVEVYEEDNKLQFKCNCEHFSVTKTCSHIPAVIMNYYDNIFPIEQKDILTRSREVLDQYLPKSQAFGDKKKLTMELTLEVDDSYFYSCFYRKNGSKVLTVKLKLGDTKLYQVGDRKLAAIIDAQEEDREVYVGKEFTYNHKKYYFSKEDQKIIDYFKKRNDENLKLYVIENPEALFSLLQFRPFTINPYGKIQGIKDDFPYRCTFLKKDDCYQLLFEQKDVIDLFDDKNYFVREQFLYHPNMLMRKFLQLLEEQDLTELQFQEEYLENFGRKILPMLESQINIDDSFKKMFRIELPKVELYFDITCDTILCTPVFRYQNNKIDYFETEYQQIIRNYDYENEVVEQLLQRQFQINIEKKQIILEDLERIVDFLEEDLIGLSELYDVYTSENLKKTKVIHSSAISTSFSISKDNILQYNFELGEIDEKELPMIFTSMKAQKKYYRLKSGDIIDLRNKKIIELEQLVVDMDLKVNSGTKEIPKYYALYLDSIKNEKYSIVKTDHSFANFIANFNAYKNAKVQFTKRELSILRDYQIIGIKWLYNIHKCDLGGILADEMGLGKSLQVIYLIKKLLKEDKDSKYLIVVPTSLIYNWENEFRKFASKLKYQIITGTKDKRKRLLQNVDCSIYITSYGLLREDVDWYKKIFFTLCVIDEAQNIKNSKTGITKTVKEIRAKTKLALTGTPIENSVAELWSIFDFLMPGFLASEEKFFSKYKITDFNEENKAKVALLNQLIAPFILRRKKKDVINDLPAKIVHHFYIEFTEEEKRLYVAVAKKMQRNMDEFIQKSGYEKSKFMILSLLAKLRQLCVVPQLVIEDCTVSSSKIEQLLLIVKEAVANGHKILLFTSFKRALNVVKDKLEKENITAYVIDGQVSSKKRLELVEKFNHDDTNIFLIMLKSGGVGLNLTSADVVIHLDLWWNPQAENQASDRTHRIGQKNTVEVIKLIVRGTIEEKILQLQEKKQLLSEQVLEGVNMEGNILDRLTEKEIRTLLSCENMN